MSGLLLALFASVVAGLGGRDQTTFAGVVQRHGPRAGLLWAGVLVSCASAGFAGWLGTLIVPLLEPRARLMFAALALALGGIELLLVPAVRRPEEPTHSLGAMALVLAAHQISDAARLLVLGIAIAAHSPIPAAIGGAMGGSALVALAWWVPDWLQWPRLTPTRRGIGVLLLVLAAAVALGA